MLGVICRAIFVARDNEGAVSRSLIAYTKKVVQAMTLPIPSSVTANARYFFHKGSPLNNALWDESRLETEKVIEPAIFFAGILYFLY